MKSQFIRPKDESKIQAKITTAMTSGTAQGKRDEKARDARGP